LLGLVLTEKHDYAGAAAELTTFIKLAPNAPDLAQARARLGELEKLTDVDQAGGLLISPERSFMTLAILGGCYSFLSQQNSPPAANELLARGIQLMPSNPAGP